MTIPPSFAAQSFAVWPGRPTSDSAVPFAAAFAVVGVVAVDAERPIVVVVGAS